jgi:four helix bundle protein
MAATPRSSYRELLVWQRAMDLAARVYQLTNLLPSGERFGLQSQIRRAAVSIPSNIAEGKGRWHLKEFLHSLSMARASLQELETQLELMLRLGYSRQEETEQLLSEAAELGRMLAGLMKSVRSRS